MNNIFTVHTPYKLIHFQIIKRGLYYNNWKPNGNKRDITFVKTVQENKEGFTNREIKDAKESRCAYNMVGRPSAADFKRMVHGNMLNKCLISVTDIKNAQKPLALTSDPSAEK